jgi:hypothetical protein
MSASEAGLPIPVVNSEGNYSEAPGLPAVRVEEADLNCAVGPLLKKAHSPSECAFVNP